MAIRISNITATFANVSHRYDGIGFNANVVAAAANSNLLHLLNTNISKFAIRLNGDIEVFGGIIANNSLGNTGQVLTSTGSGVYWANSSGGPGGSGTVTSVASGNGLTGGPVTTTGTLSVLANSGIVANSTGVFVDPTFIATLTANNTSFVGSVSAANVVSNAQLSGNLANYQLISGMSAYQTTAGLSANVATLTANNTSFVGSVSAANVVSNAQLSANLANYQLISGMSAYQTTAGLASNVATLTANNTSFVGAVSAANVVSNAQLSGNLANYQTTAGLAANVAVLAANSATFVLANNGITSNSSGVFVTQGSGLVVNSTGVHVRANSGIVANATGTFVLANSGITANSTGVFVATVSGLIVNSTGVHVRANSGITANSTGTFVTPGTGVVVNATGVHVNATYIGTLTANNTNFVGAVSAANVVSNAQLSANLANYQLISGMSAYQTTAGLAGNVATLTANLANFIIANNGLVSNSSGVFVTPGTGVVVNATGVHVNSDFIATLTANNTSFVGAVSAANVVSNAQLSANLANYQLTSGMSAYQTTAGLAANVATLTANLANYVVSNNGIVSNSSGVFVLQGTGSIVNSTGVHVLANNGITANSSGVFVTPGTGLVVNATGVHVDATYIGTLTANNTSFVGSVSAANVVSNAQLSANLANYQLISGMSAYQTTAGLAGNVATLAANSATFVLANNGIVSNSSGVFVLQGTGLVVNATGVHVQDSYIATLTANNTSFVGAVSAANVVSNAQLSGNLANYQLISGMSAYQTTAGLSANVATLTANNTSFVGSVSAANVVSNAQLSANLANYLPLAGGIVTGTVTPNSNTVSFGNTTQRWVMFGNTGNFSGNVTVTGGIIANGTIGVAGQILASNGSSIYWTAAAGGGTVTQVSTGNGLTGGPITTTGTVSVLANNGITANATGTFVTQGSGIVVNATGVHVLANNGITANSTGTFVATVSGLVVNSTGVHVRANSGIVANATGTFVLANSGITANSTGVFVATVSGLVVNSTGVHVRANNGITANSTGTFVTQGSGIVVNATGVHVLANNGIIANTTGTFVNANTGLVVNATGVHVNSSFIPNASFFRNRIINGSFDIWQRATSNTTTGYVADRWLCTNVGSTFTNSRQAFTAGQTAVPGEPAFHHRTVVTSVAAAGNYARIEQRIESVKTLAGQTAILTFYAKADASKSIAVAVTQNFGTGGTPSANVVTHISKPSLTTSWQKFSLSFSVPSISGKTLGTTNDGFLSVEFWFDAGSTWNTTTNTLGQQSGTFDISQVQLEAGAVASDFETRPIGLETLLCQRYCQKFALFTVYPYDSFTTSYGASDAIYPLKLFPIPMRGTPTATLENSGVEYFNQSSVWTSTTLNALSNNNATFYIYCSADGAGLSKLMRTGSGGTANNPVVTFTAEL